MGSGPSGWIFPSAQRERQHMKLYMGVNSNQDWDRPDCVSVELTPAFIARIETLGKLVTEHKLHQAVTFYDYKTHWADDSLIEGVTTLHVEQLWGGEVQFY